MNIRKLKTGFERLVKADSLAHSYLFFGESAEACRRFAASLAYYLERGAWEGGGTTLLDADIRDGRIASGIDDVRTISHFLSQFPVISSHRTFVLYEASYLTIPAQQAILKIAEEPPAHALILITARHPDDLIPPLASRFQKLYVSDSIEVSVEQERELEALARRILAGSDKEQGELLKEMLEREGEVERFVKVLFAEFRKHPFEHWRSMKALLRRWTAMHQWNTNRKLQLEAAFAVAREESRGLKV